MPRSALLLLAVLAPLLAASRAHADPEPQRPAFRLKYEVAPSALNCPPASSLASLINSKFGYDLFPDDARATLAVTIRPRAGQFEAELHGLDAEGVTQWQSTAPSKAPTCATLVEALALRVFMQFATPVGELPPAWTLPAPPPPTGTEPAPSCPIPELRDSEPPSMTVPSSSSAPLSSTATPSPFLRPEASLALVVGLFDTPHVALGGAVHLGVRLSAVPLFVGFEGRAVIDHRESIPGITGHFSLATGALVVCWTPSVARLCLLGGGGPFDIPILPEHRAAGRIVPVGGFGFRGSFDVYRGERFVLRPYADLFVPTLRAQANLMPVAADETSRQEAWTMSFFLPSFGFAVVTP